MSDETALPIDSHSGMPESWTTALGAIRSASTPHGIEAAAQEARALMLLDEMRAADLRAKAMERQSARLNFATWVLAGATVALIIATVASAFIARS